jgi:hypothetical protein
MIKVMWMCCHCLSQNVLLFCTYLLVICDTTQCPQDDMKCGD